MPDLSDGGQPVESTSYQEVIEDFCNRFELDSPQEVAAGALFDVNGVNLAITLNEVVPSALSVSIYVDVGSPPQSGESVVLRMLLQQNFANSASRGLAYCISPASGRVVGVIHVGLNGLNGQGLESLVNMLVDLTLEWREGYFLWSAKGASGAGRSPEV